LSWAELEIRKLAISILECKQLNRHARTRDVSGTASRGASSFLQILSSALVLVGQKKALGIAVRMTSHESVTPGLLSSLNNFTRQNATKRG